MKLNDIRPAKGSVKKSKRRGCGTGSGHGGTSTRGHKGQKSRAGSGAKVPAWFEGGQMPLQRRLPKRGFTPLKRMVYQLVDISSLAKISGAKEIDPAYLAKKGLIKSIKKPIKILGKGELKNALTVKASAFSDGARKSIEAAGGKAEIAA
ncbi:MAG: 50S ribosomal protein L15 [Candidatus Edwardsbacteria bacterium]|nr:50S ribosomal protein L15 [Candidatus Edwardsbacteria bacterium]MBU1576737.1 50S ribosomal protein L15 [Candidatus Edwardsbacteria bacterium]MBU2464521.1 50S ribosomal protein L15 [Candidatus Edwardsbacteria bacterium]MBU2594796.1 50S ribosomal protein L15 [Candidatus Edwardsbacteria bacterium]